MAKYLLQSLVNQLQNQILQSKLYKNCSISGPTINTRTGRKHVCVWLIDEKLAINLTLARFRYQEHIGRLLEPEEEVDHKDDDFTNDEIVNLQILTKGENVAKAQTKYQNDTEVICFWCEKKFTLTPKQQSQRYMNRKRTTGPFCSHRCAGLSGLQQRWG